MKKSLLIGVAISTVILGASTPSDARRHGGHGFSGGHHGGHHHFHGHHGFHGRGPRFFGGGPSFFWGPPWWGPPGWYYPPAYAAPVVVAPPPVYIQPEPPPAYWYYCRSYGAYYPNVQSCPEAWVTVPGAP